MRAALLILRAHKPERYASRSTITVVSRDIQTRLAQQADAIKRLCQTELGPPAGNAFQAKLVVSLREIWSSARKCLSRASLGWPPSDSRRRGFRHSDAGRRLLHTHARLSEPDCSARLLPQRIGGIRRHSTVFDGKSERRPQRRTLPLCRHGPPAYVRPATLPNMISSSALRPAIGVLSLALLGARTVLTRRCSRTSESNQSCLRCMDLSPGSSHGEDWSVLMRKDE